MKNVPRCTPPFDMFVPPLGDLEYELEIYKELELIAMCAFYLVGDDQMCLEHNPGLPRDCRRCAVLLHKCPRETVGAVVAVFDGKVNHPVGAALQIHRREG